MPPRGDKTTYKKNTFTYLPGRRGKSIDITFSRCSRRCVGDISSCIVCCGHDDNYVDNANIYTTMIS